jgi:hypothetical protein
MFGADRFLYRNQGVADAEPRFLFTPVAVARAIDGGA